MRERLGVPKYGGIRASLTSSDIILVHNVDSECDYVEEGGRVMYDGTYYKKEPDQMISGNLKLARSRESATVSCTSSRRAVRSYSTVSLNMSRMVLKMILRAQGRWPLS